ncbi:hypothetical protein [Streptosporangium sp. NPDC051022]|uniref:hypothetical protein n=1 Tax=Streptosporangium sp. NPDC051022 TaxID=3155752 RepID=UPI0034164FD3
MQARPAETGDGHSARQVERLLVEAERSHAQGATDRDPEWTVMYGVEELNAEAGNCWRLLGAHHRAAACAEAAVSEFNERLPRSAQLNRVHAAEAYLEMGELEQALISVRTAIPVSKALSSARSVELIRRFDDRLEPYGDSVTVREFRDHLNAELAA